MLQMHFTGPKLDLTTQSLSSKVKSFRRLSQTDRLVIIWLVI